MSDQNVFPKLFVTDLDGTALGGEYRPYRRLPDPYSVFLDRLAERGCRWTTNSGWSTGLQWQLMLTSAVKSRPAFLMGNAGMQLEQVTQSGPVPVQPFSAQMEEKVAGVRKEYLIPLIKDLCGRFGARFIQFPGHWFDMIPVAEDAEEFSSYVKKHYAAEPALHVELVGEDPRLEAYPRLLVKRESLSEVLRILGLSPDEVMVAGDDPMDLSMMAPSCARYLICPDNAHRAVKEYVQRMDGEIGSGHSSVGVIQAFRALAKRHGWNF